MNKEELRKLRDKESSKEWRKNNPDKIKAYLERTKEHRKKWSDKYYERNRKLLLAKQKQKHRENGYAKYKKGDELKAQKVRRLTRLKYPLNGKKCKFCDNSAKHRHHTTKPLKVDKFLFLCERCHKNTHGNNDYVSGEDGEQDVN